MSRNRTGGVVDFVVLAAFLAAAGWIYSGFFSPDPLYVNSARGGSLTLLSALVKIIFPIVVISIAGIFILARRGVLGALQVGLIVAGIVIGGIVLLAAGAELYYFKTSARSTDQYHTYLQIRPEPLVLRTPLGTSGVKRIFCLGGSTTAWGDSKGRRWTEMLEEARNNPGVGRKVEVYNQGREWYTSLHSLVNYETNLRKYRPDTLIVMHAINDLMHNADFGVFSNGPFRDDYGHYLGPATTLIKRHMFEGILWTNFRRIWKHLPRTEITTDEFPGLSGFVRNLETIAELAEKDGTSVIFLTEPYIFKESMNESELDALSMLNTEAIGDDRQWSLKTILNGMKKYNAAIKSLNGKHGARVVDLEAVIPKSLEYFKDDVHYTDKAFPLIPPVL